MPDVSAQRLALYHEQTMPVVDRYRTLGRLLEIDADQTIAGIHSDIEAALDLLERDRAPTVKDALWRSTER